MSSLNDPRVLFAAERTLLAWSRTGLALMAFGFLIERAGLLMQVLRPEAVQTAADSASFWLGLGFISLGALSALFACRQYSSVLKSLHAAEIPPGYNARWGMLINLVIALLGIALVASLLVLEHV